MTYTRTPGALHTIHTLRCHGWEVRYGDLDGVPEMFYLDERVICLDMRHWPEGRLFALTHALGHVEWGHVDDSEVPFTDEQESVADLVARLRLDIREPWVTSATGG